MKIIKFNRSIIILYLVFICFLVLLNLDFSLLSLWSYLLGSEFNFIIKYITGYGIYILITIILVKIIIQFITQFTKKGDNSLIKVRMIGYDLGLRPFRGGGIIASLLIGIIYFETIGGKRIKCATKGLKEKFFPCRMTEKDLDEVKSFCDNGGLHIGEYYDVVANISTGEVKFKDEVFDKYIRYDEKFIDSLLK